jgi:thioesterase domain-containing protein
VGLRDNFFALGGHSLLAIRVIAEINKTLNTHVNVPQFFQNPTIEQLAKSLGPERRFPLKPRVLMLQQGATRLPFYFIGGGPVEIRIAKHMGGARALYATDVPLPIAWRRTMSSPNPEEWPTIAQLGALHGQAIRDHAGTMPCVVAGYSFGGKVVVEAAREVMRAGGRIAAVVLIDSTPYSSTTERLKTTIRRNMQDGAGGSVGAPRSSIERALRSLGWLAAQAPPAVKRRLAGAVYGDEDPQAQESNGWLDEEGGPVTLSDMTQLFLRLRSSFDPDRLDAHAVLYRTRRAGDAMLTEDRRDNGWGDRFSGGLEIIESRGDHWSLVRDERNAAALAQQINETLDKLSPASDCPTP